MLTKYYSDHQIKENEVDGAYSTYGGEEWYIQGFLRGNLRETNQLEYLGVNGRIILEFILRKWDGGMDWTDLVQDRDKVRVLVTAVMNLRVP